VRKPQITHFCYTIFIAINLLHNSLNILLGELDGCITHLIFLRNVHQLQQPCASEKPIRLSSSCTGLNFVLAVTSSITSSLPDVCLQMAGLTVSKRWKSEGANSELRGGWGGTLHASFVITSCFFQTCVCVSCFVVLKEDFSNVSLRSNSTETLVQSFKNVSIHMWVNGFIAWHNVYQNHHLCLPKVSDNDCWRGSLNFFLRGKIWWCRFTDGVSCLVPVTVRDRNFYHQPRKRRTNLNTPRSTQSVRLHGTQRAHTFEY
jgi:hypothetical protein